MCANCPYSTQKLKISYALLLSAALPNVSLSCEALYTFVPRSCLNIANAWQSIGIQAPACVRRKCAVAPWRVIQKTVERQPVVLRWHVIERLRGNSVLLLPGTDELTPALSRPSTSATPISSSCTKTDHTTSEFVGLPVQAVVFFCFTAMFAEPLWLPPVWTCASSSPCSVSYSIFRSSSLFSSVILGWRKMSYRMVSIIEHCTSIGLHSNP